MEPRTSPDRQRGALLILAAAFVLIVLAFMGTVFLTTFTTSTSTATNEFQSTRAFAIAEGGMEYILKNRVFPNYSMGAATANLGAGSFTVSTPTYLTADPGVAGTTINVQSTAVFPNAGRIIIDSELITYTGKNATQFNAGVTRGSGGTTAAAHATGNAVYPVTTVTNNPLLVESTTIDVTSTVGFSIPGVIVIDTEYIFCTGVTGTTAFTNCTRGYRGSPATAHVNLSNVFQYALTSTGTVGATQRAVGRSAQFPGAMMAYAKLAGDGTPYYRRWNGISWGPELTATAVPADLQYVVLRFARTRNEAVLGTISSNGDIRVQVWNGTTWGEALLLANIGLVNDDYRGLDIEYETSGDRAVVAYNDGSADPDYRIWSGLAWTAAANIDIPTTGVPNWIELAPNPLSGSNEIVMLTLDNNSDVYGKRWDGAAWADMSAFATWDDSASTSTRKAIDIAYERQTGRAMFIWGSSTKKIQRYRLWSGAALSGIRNLAIASMGGVAHWIRLAADPFSDSIMYSVQDSKRDLNTRCWNGAAWDSEVEHPEHDTNTEDTSKNSDIAFETAAVNAGKAWLLWGNGSEVSRRPWNGAWGVIATTGDDTSWIHLAADPRSGAVFSCLYESTASLTDDIWESHLTSGNATWSVKYTVWGGPTVASPVMERCDVAVERGYPLVVQGWREVVK